jgi:hypothetical protein
LDARFLGGGIDFPPRDHRDGSRRPVIGFMFLFDLTAGVGALFALIGSWDGAAKDGASLQFVALREEYFYNEVREVGSGRYESGHMLFVLAEPGSSSGYVLITAATDWRVIRWECKNY